jgi:hypothetical protein
MIAYLDFNQFPQNSVKADSDFRDLQRQLFNNIILDSVFIDFQCQLFINIKADSNFSQFLSLILHQTWRDHQHLVSFVSHWDSCWSANVTKSNNALSFNSKSVSAINSLHGKASGMIVVSIVALQQRAATSELIVIYFASHIDVLDHEGADEQQSAYNNPDAGKKQHHENTNDDNARALSTTIPTLHNRMTPSLSLKFIVESLLEGKQFAPITFQAFESIVTLTSIINFQLVVEFDLILHSKGAQAPSSALIVGYCSSKISFHFFNNCRIFCEGVKEQINNGDAIVKQR